MGAVFPFEVIVCYPKTASKAKRLLLPGVVQVWEKEW